MEALADRTAEVACFADEGRRRRGGRRGGMVTCCYVEEEALVVGACTGMAWDVHGDGASFDCWANRVRW